MFYMFYPCVHFFLSHMLIHTTLLRPSVRDIVYVINFNTFEASWGPHNLDVLHSLMRPFFPVIIGMHAGVNAARGSQLSLHQ